MTAQRIPHAQRRDSAHRDAARRAVEAAQPDLISLKTRSIEETLASLGYQVGHQDEVSRKVFEIALSNAFERYRLAVAERYALEAREAAQSGSWSVQATAALSTAVGVAGLVNLVGGTVVISGFAAAIAALVAGFWEWAERRRPTIGEEAEGARP
jgi:hypothetical protein